MYAQYRRPKHLHNGNSASLQLYLSGGSSCADRNAVGTLRIATQPRCPRNTTISWTTFRRPPLALTISSRTKLKMRSPSSIEKIPLSIFWALACVPFSRHRSGWRFVFRRHGQTPAITHVRLKSGEMAEATAALTTAEAHAKKQLKSASRTNKDTHRFPPGTLWELIHADCIILVGLTQALR